MTFVVDGGHRLARSEDRSEVSGTDHRLAERHFRMQHAGAGERPHLGTVDPFLRSLLFTDGTVTRALEAQTLCRVTVEMVEQSRAALSVQAARCLEAEAGAECVRRRVTMKAEGATPAVWAESHLLLDRLPAQFIRLLNRTSHGIGGSIEQARLESRRELLWFRLGTPPSWADQGRSVPAALVRHYRIITGDRPALLICEAFAVERQLGVYRPLGWPSGAVTAAR
jgi:chorismate-pyruvate lyase